MARGGKRQGAGRPSIWNHKETKLIRVPAVFADQLVEIAHKFDDGDTLDLVTESNCDSVGVSPTPGQMSILDICPQPTFQAADGDRWLTTGQAFDRAVQRGFDASKGKNSFKGWSRRSPDKCLEEYGLRRLANSSTRRNAAGFEDAAKASS